MNENVLIVCSPADMLRRAQDEREPDAEPCPKCGGPVGVSYTGLSGGVLMKDCRVCGWRWQEPAKDRPCSAAS